MRCCQSSLLIEGEKASAINGKCSNRQQNRRTSPSTELSVQAGSQAFFVTFRVAFLFFVPCFFLFNGRFWRSRGGDFLKTGKPSFYPKLGGSVGSVGAPVRTKVGGRLLMTHCGCVTKRRITLAIFFSLLFCLLSSLWGHRKLDQMKFKIWNISGTEMAQMTMPVRICHLKQQQCSI